MYREFDVEELHRQYDPDIHEYDEDWDEVPTLVDDEGHFETLVEWAAKSMGYKIGETSYILERDYSDGWTNFNCPALKGGGFKAKLNQNTVEDDYYQHLTVERAAWSLEDDGRVTVEQDKTLVLCASASSGDHAISIEEHEIGKCPHLLYYHEVIKERIKKVDVTLYIKVKCSDEEDILDSTMEDAISDVVHDFENNLYDAVRDYVEDNVDTDVYYEGDMESRLHKHKVTDVQRMPR